MQLTARPKPQENDAKPLIYSYWGQNEAFDCFYRNISKRKHLRFTLFSYRNLPV